MDTEKKNLTLAYSTCPNDTFIFKAIARELIDCTGMAFSISLDDVESLNQAAARQQFDITKLSVAAFGSLSGEYVMLRTGAALGQGCGPLLVTRPGQPLESLKRPVVAVPGMGTTAFHLFSFFIHARYPDIRPQIESMPFETIMPAVLEGRADAGVIIHEGRFVYQDMGLDCQADLGQWWEDETGLPIPLGCIAVRRGLGHGVAADVQDLIKKSIEHAFLHPDAARDYILAHAQELAEDVIRQHIALYVNDFSHDIGPRGEAAVITFFEKAKAAGLLSPDVNLLPAALFAG